MVGFPLFCLGLPAAQALLLAKRRHRLEQAATEKLYLFLYESYRPAYFYWDSTRMLTLLALTVAT